MKLDPERATLVVIDVQEAFRKALPSFDEVAAASATLARGAAAIGIPIVVTEQYPEGLGETVPEVAEHLPQSATGSTRSASRRSRPTASTSVSEIRRSSAGSRPTSASTRRCST